MNVRKLSAAEVTFTVELEPEELPVKFDSGEPEYDREDERRIMERLATDHQEAWCCVVVTAEWQGIKAHASLGCCSFDCGQYPSGDKVAREIEEYARENGMFDEALDALNNEVQRQADKARELLAKVTIDAG